MSIFGESFGRHPAMGRDVDGCQNRVPTNPLSIRKIIKEKLWSPSFFLTHGQIIWVERL